MFKLKIGIKKGKSILVENIVWESRNIVFGILIMIF